MTKSKKEQILEDRINILKNTHIFSETGADVLNEIANALIEKHARPEKVIIHKGDMGNSMYIIVNGKVRVHDGNHVLTKLGSGSIFGEYSLIDEETRSASVTAEEPSDLLMLSQDDFFKIIFEKKEIIKGVLKVLVNRMRSMNVLEEKLSKSYLKIQKQKDEIELQHQSISKQKELLEEQNYDLLNLNEEKNHLLSVVVHGIKNPLTSSLCLIDLIKEEEKISELQQEYTSIVENSLNRINKMINELLNVNRIESKTYSLKTETIEISGLIKEVLINLSNNESTYYKAILQNLFFATLNTPIKKRKFREKKDYKGINKDYGEHEFYRYEECFKNPNQILQLFKGIPFLNGGLFECLDKKREKIIIDGFSRVKKNQPIVPNCLFFSNEQLVDLNKEYGTENKIYKAEGLINILQRYHFTIDENTPSDVEIALDPELLGRVFENLLASYNPETATTARKATGSYYTPREIVNYMVEESLKAYFKTKLDKIKNIDQDLEELFSCDIETHSFNKKEVKILIEAINNLKIIDPAVGSGAFPMGILQKLVHILSKIDSHNELWKKEQIEAVEKNVPDAVLKRDLIKKIEFNFDNNELDYGRKLYLIQNCIYGVDIQSIAIQITKLRFFISLLVDENVNKGLDNMGIDPLPNLETKFVAANSLIGLQSNGQMALKDPPIQKLEDELKQVRIKYFSANDSNEKRKLREEDENIRLQLAGLLKQGGFSTEDTGKIINWDPYNLNTSSNWFDSEWMFGIKSGFDIVIANPPYVSYYSRESAKTVGTTKEIAILRGEFDFTKYERKTGRLNLWMFFVERFVKLLRMNGITAFIVDVNFTKDLARNIRRYLLENISIKQFIHNLNEFEYVASGQVILIVQKDSNILDNKIRIKDSLLGSGVQIQQSEISAPNYNLFAFTTDPIVSKLSSETKLGKLQQLQLTTGIQVGGIEIFEGKQIKDYFYQINWDYKKVFPAVDPKSVRRYSKPEFQRGIVFDYELASKITGATKKSAVVLRKYEDFLNNEKIFIRQSASEILATIGAPKTCGEYSLFSLIINNKDFDIKYLLALFNSKLYTYFAVKSGIILMERGTQPQIRKSGLEKLPIKKIPFYSQKPFIDLVDKILVITRDENYLQNSVKQVKFLEYEKQIDQMVYKLYGLGEKEIKIIENFNKN